MTFFTGVFTIIATYAWFSSTADIRIELLKISIKNDNDFSVSLDGVNFSNEIILNKNSVSADIDDIYPTHYNQWAGKGLFAVSSNGSSSPSNYLFDMFINVRASDFIGGQYSLTYIDARKVFENKKRVNSPFISIDLFFRNNSKSPSPDNLFLLPSSRVDIVEVYNGQNLNSLGEIITKDEEFDPMSDGTFNSLRVGFSRGDTAKTNAPIAEIQALECENNCQSVIYEPNSYSHSQASIDRSLKKGIVLLPERQVPTFGIHTAGNNLHISNGHIGTGIPLDAEHFSLQVTHTNLNQPLLQLPDGITKVRLYVWVEGQDLDSLDTWSSGSRIRVNLDFYKDIAGYEIYND